MLKPFVDSLKKDAFGSLTPQILPIGVLLQALGPDVTYHILFQVRSIDACIANASFYFAGQVGGQNA